MAYLLDANVFIQAKNLQYGFDFCPGFWDWLILANQAGKVFSVEQVGTELAGHQDELSTWAAARGGAFFLPSPPNLQPSLTAVVNWVQAQSFEPAAVSLFLQVADFYLVAQALALSATVITHEIASETKRKVKIPTVCIGLGIRYMSVYEMLRVEGARFVLPPPPGETATEPG